MLRIQAAASQAARQQDLRRFCARGGPLLQDGGDHFDGDIPVLAEKKNSTSEKFCFCRKRAVNAELVEAGGEPSHCTE